MSFEDALWTYLTDDAGVAALVDDRVYKNHLEEKTVLPAIAFFRVDAVRDYTYDAYPDSSAYTTARMQFDCWSDKPSEAQDVGEAVLAALSGFSGYMGAVLIGASFAVNEFDRYEPNSGKKNRRTIDFLISYQDAVPATS